MNHDFEKAHGLVIGINPIIHGRHHKACNWIIHELYVSVIDHFPEDFQCNSNFEFRSMYGVRGGNSEANDNIYSAHHFHSISQENVEILKKTM